MRLKAQYVHQSHLRWSSESIFLESTSPSNYVGPLEVLCRDTLPIRRRFSCFENFPYAAWLFIPGGAESIYRRAKFLRKRYAMRFVKKSFQLTVYTPVSLIEDFFCLFSISFFQNLSPSFISAYASFLNLNGKDNPLPPPLPRRSFAVSVWHASL